MKVLMLSKACLVGAYQRKLEELAARGVELTVVVPPYWRDERGMMPLEKKYTQGYQLVVAPMRFNGHFHLHYYPTLPTILRDVRPDIMHVDEEPWDFVTFHAIRQARPVNACPLFFSWQNLLRRYPPPFDWFARYAFRHCAHAIAGMASVEVVLRAKGYRGHVSVIPQFGVDPEIFCPADCRGEVTPPLRPYTIAFIGRLKREKGVDVLLRAVAELRRDWRVRVLGAGPEKENLQRLAAQLHLADRVQFDAQIPSTQMPDYYRQIDLCVLPSRRAPNWMEQFGRVLIEAMASGVPVIGSDSGDIPNVLGDAGLLFPEGDAVALRAQLERVMCDEQLQAQLRVRGRARVLEKFTQASVAEQTVQVYQHLLTHTP
jgi:glycosyltransferase involved in cell wall biosynthesis